MTATPTTTREAEAYLAEVRDQLADLGEEERADLLEDLAQHLADISSEEGNADSDLRALLGDPASYAAELRAAAGLPPKAGSPTESRDETWARRAAALWEHPKSVALRNLAGELAPAWWVLRGLLAVGFVVASSHDRWRHVPIPQMYGSRLLGLCVMTAVVAVSIAVGRAGYRRWRRVVLLADVVVALGGLVLLLEVLSMGNIGGGPNPRSVVYVEGQSAALESPHGPVTNIYPFDSQGRPLEGVLLYDQDGRPLRVARQEWWADGCERTPAHPLAADGVPVEFVYPYNYRLERAGQGEFESREQLGASGCLPQIPRPIVPVPTFPAPAAEPPATTTPPQPAP